MGNRCSDADKKPAKPLDAPSSDEGEGEEGDQEEGEEEAGEDDELAEDKAETEKTLSEGLKRGKTAAFKDAIDHATALGLDESTITKAESKLEEHKAFRKREAFEQELADFMKGDESNKIPECEKMLAQGKDYGVNDKVLNTIKDRIAELELKRPLEKDELEQAKQYMELCTRRFVASCIKGRQTQRINLETGDTLDATISLDLTLKNMTIVSDDNTQTYKFDAMEVKRGADVSEVADSDSFSELKDADKESTVALMPGSGATLCFLEANKAKGDEFLCGCTVLLGMGLPGRKKAAPKADDSLKKAAAAESKPEPPATEERKLSKEESNNNAVEENNEVVEAAASPKETSPKDKAPPPPAPAEEPDEASEPAESGSEASGGSE